MRAITATIRQAARVLKLQASISDEAYRIISAGTRELLPLLDRDYARGADRRLARWKRDNGITQSFYSLGFQPATYLWRGASRALKGHHFIESAITDVLTHFLVSFDYPLQHGRGDFYKMVEDRLTRDDGKGAVLDPEHPEKLTHYLNMFLFRVAENKAKNVWREVKKQYSHQSIDQSREEIGDSIEDAMVHSIHRNDPNDLMTALKDFPGIERLVDKALDMMVSAKAPKQQVVKEKIKDWILNPRPGHQLQSGRWVEQDLQEIAFDVLQDEIDAGAPYNMEDARNKRRGTPSWDRFNSINVTLTGIWRKAEKIGPAILAKIRKNPESVFGNDPRQLQNALDALRHVASEHPSF